MKLKILLFHLVKDWLLISLFLLVCAMLINPHFLEFLFRNIPLFHPEMLTV